MKYPEDDLQKATAKFLDMTGLLWCHVANERKTSPAAGARLKAKGVKSGVPDVMIFKAVLSYVGLAIELKIKPNKVSENQKKWLETLERNEWAVKVCYSIEEVMDTVEKYIKDEKVD